MFSPVCVSIQQIIWLLLLNHTGALSDLRLLSLDKCKKVLGKICIIYDFQAALPSFCHTDLIFLLEICDHNYDGGSLLPHHPPEVAHRVHSWALCCNVGSLFISITLKAKWNTDVLYILCYESLKRKHKHWEHEEEGTMDEAQVRLKNENYLEIVSIDVGSEEVFFIVWLQDHSAVCVWRWTAQAQEKGIQEVCDSKRHVQRMMGNFRSWYWHLICRSCTQRYHPCSNVMNAQTSVCMRYVSSLVVLLTR